ncbi:ImmA/IrrE family metallo-endopeptidase [Kribbella sp. NPDC000426]|uniref:ImmA/IrrE family metallo-endopeptidase n=1 Tax=Kribbella sp. NPDC000426 TaxID=3154255 RepID=UPI00332D3142
MQPIQLEVAVGKEPVRAEDLHRALDTELSKMRSGTDWCKWMDAAASFPTFGFGNVVLINLQMPQASWVAHANTWRRLGREVKPPLAIRILYPVRSRTAVAAAMEDALGSASEKQRTGGQIEQQVIGFQVGVVYDVTGTVGPPLALPPLPATASATVAKRLWNALTREAGADGFTVDIRPTGDASEGCTDHKAKRIVIADHLDDFRAVERLAHEVAHARLHSSAETGESASVLCRGIREVEAESVAHVVLAHHGLSFDAQSFEYLVGWAHHIDPEQPGNVIKATGARVVDTTRTLIKSTDRFLKAHRPALSSVPARPLGSVLIAPDLDGPIR